jgi:hypothetical protein
VRQVSGIDQQESSICYGLTASAIHLDLAPFTALLLVLRYPWALIEGRANGGFHFNSRSFAAVSVRLNILYEEE